MRIAPKERLHGWPKGGMAQESLSRFQIKRRDPVKSLRLVSLQTTWHPSGFSCFFPHLLLIPCSQVSEPPHWFTIRRDEIELNVHRLGLHLSGLRKSGRMTIGKSRNTWGKPSSNMFKHHHVVAKRNRVTKIQTTRMVISTIGQRF